MIVLCDSSPLHYLILIGQEHLFTRLFGKLIIPPNVKLELQQIQTPEMVRQFIQILPAWIEILAAQHVELDPQLGPGETEVIILAPALCADLVLLDDRRARNAAIARGLNVVGTLGILDYAAAKKYVNLPEALANIRLTNFHVSERVLIELLNQNVRRQNESDNPPNSSRY